MAAAQAGEVHVKALYPVKSCRGIQVPQAYITPTADLSLVKELEGVVLMWHSSKPNLVQLVTFKLDRQWLVVNAQGRFQTQRQVPKMALIEVTMPLEALDCTWGSLPPDAALCIKAPGMDPLYIPLVPPAPLKTIENVTVWGWTGPALFEGVDADRWFSEFLGKPLQFVRFDNATISTNPQYAEGYQISFTKCIFVEGCKAFVKDTWATFTIGKSTFHGVKIQGRCKMTTDQRTAQVGTVPLQTLRTFRAGPLLASNIRNMKSDVFFGQNVVCKDLGMPVNRVLPAVQVNDVVNVKQAVSIAELMST